MVCRISSKAFCTFSTMIVLLTVTLASPATASPPPDFSQRAADPVSSEKAPNSLQARLDMIEIPAGDYPIGRDDGAASERPAHTVRLGAFRIDRTEVTNLAFAEFLNALGLQMSGSFAAGELREANAPGASYRLLHEGTRATGPYPIIALDDAEALIGLRDGRFVPKPGYELHPVTETTWAGALAYCVWRGARLPTEVEWEAAARGSYGRPYPWGDEAPSDQLAFTSNRTRVTARVGSRPAGASPFGLLDMSGSMAEWTSTLKRPYPYDPDDGREVRDVAGERVTRGGDYVFDTGATVLTTTHRDGFSNAPERGHRHIGFRCAA